MVIMDRDCFETGATGLSTSLFTYVASGSGRAIASKLIPNEMRARTRVDLVFIMMMVIDGSGWFCFEIISCYIFIM